MSVAETLPHENRSGQGAVRLLYFGQKASLIDAVLKRSDDVITALRLTDPVTLRQELNPQLSKIRYDLMICDVRRSNKQTLPDLSVLEFVDAECRGQNVPLLVFCDSGDREAVEAVSGDKRLLTNTINATKILQQMNDLPSRLPDSESQAMAATDQEETKAPPATLRAVPSGFEVSTSKLVEADRNLWRFFQPIANFAYKKLAIVMLSALFLTFVLYGMLIVFFMISSSWSVPFQLSRGHTLVDKIERDVAATVVQRNRIAEEVSQAKTKARQADRLFRDARTKLQLIGSTIDEEVRRLNARHNDLVRHIGSLSTVISDYQAVTNAEQLSQKLDAAYKSRAISVTAFEKGKMATIEARHRLNSLDRELADLKRELDHVLVNLAFLNGLKEESHRQEMTAAANTESDFAALARQLIDMKTQLVTAQQDVALSKGTQSRLSNSLGLIEESLQTLRQHPAARALQQPVTVLFAPYSNVPVVKPGAPLFACRFSLVWCRQVGEVTASVEGETTSEHPLFNRQMRGVFLEARFTETQAAREELIHAGRPPLLF